MSSAPVVMAVSQGGRVDGGTDPIRTEVHVEGYAGRHRVCQDMTVPSPWPDPGVRRGDGKVLMITGFVGLPGLSAWLPRVSELLSTE